MQAQHPDKRVMLVAEKGTMGVGSSRVSGVNSNVALVDQGHKQARMFPFVNVSAPIVAGTNGIPPIFLTTVLASQAALALITKRLGQEAR